MRTVFESISRSWAREAPALRHAKRQRYNMSQTCDQLFSAFESWSWWCFTNWHPHAI